MKKLFPILDEPSVPLVGRSKFVSRLKNNYISNNPKHLSVVGPRFSGKSVLLKSFAECMRQDKISAFKIVIYWELNNLTPKSDEEFLKTICKKIGSELRKTNKEYAEILTTCTDPYNDLRDVIAELSQEEEFKILMIWDGFDRPLGSGELSRNLWDQLRELAQSKNFRLVTASRKPLHELIRDENSHSSKFWNIFDPNMFKIDVFDDEDQDAISNELVNIDFKSGAIKELVNWTGGFPPLYLSVVNELLGMPLSHVDNNIVNKAAESSYESCVRILQICWNDCSETAKELFISLFDGNEIPIANTGNKERSQLIDMGLAKISNKTVTLSCRMMEQYVKEQRPGSGNISRLFKDNKDYFINIRSVLDLRLNHIKNINPRLKVLINRSIEDIPDNPSDCLKNLRGIVEHALALVLDIEFPEVKEIPKEWQSIWKKENRSFDPQLNFPDTPARQLITLQNMTGCYPGQKIQPQAKHTKKSIYFYLSAIKSFGDYGHHSGSEDVPVGSAVCAIMMCIEMAESLYPD